MLNFKEICIGFLFFILFVITIKYYTDNLSDNFNSDRADYYSFKMRFFGIFVQDALFSDKLKFLSLPLLSYLSLIIFSILFIEIKKKI